MNIIYEYHYIMNEDFIIKFRLPLIKIPSNPVTRFVKEDTKEREVEICQIF